MSQILEYVSYPLEYVYPVAGYFVCARGEKSGESGESSGDGGIISSASGMISSVPGLGSMMGSKPEEDVKDDNEETDETKVRALPAYPQIQFSCRPNP